MLRHSQELVDACELICLADDSDDVQTEFDSLRREPSSHCTSTAEAVAAALVRIDHSLAAAKAADHIQRSVRVMVKAQLEHWNSAPPRKESSSLRSIRRLLYNSNTSRTAEPARDDSEIIYRRVDPISTPLINAFYRKNKYRATAKHSDVIWEARSVSKNEISPILGAGRLVPKTSDRIYFLRNLFVADTCRRRGIGKALIQAALGTETRESLRCYCFLRQELEPIYRAAGLEVLDCQSLPKWIGEEYTKVQGQQNGEELIVMGRGVVQ